MSKTVRLTDAEQEAVRKKAVALNKKLMERNKQPMKDSEVVHAVIELALEKLNVGSSGTLILED
ncbi:mobilization protein [Acinetobacter higginsii]|jgi:hypothetical protein|uniref:mobilization protein n=1 Tax=Acinetobacter higginsii TaxID=70347 RepID=UPI001F4A516D|nr:mobilization protein [Acinetobacter higginsii]MCH7341477.1 mobilization protein [Acinetobacter higginsii]